MRPGLLAKPAVVAGIAESGTSASNPPSARLPPAIPTEMPMRLIGLCVGVLCILGAVTPTFANQHALGMGFIDHDVYPTQDLPFPEATTVVVHPWTSRATTTYLITLDDAPLAVLGVGQYVVWARHRAT